MHMGHGIMSKFKFGSVCAMAVGAAMLAGGSAQAANLIVDGNFSSPNVAGGWSMFANGDVGAWQNTSENALEVGNSGVYGLGCVSSGCQNLEVNANNYDTVQQTVSGLKVGQAYVVSWAYGGRPGGGAQALNVSFGNSLLTTDTGSLGSWTNNSFVIYAKDTSGALQFASQNLGGLPSYGNEITNVSITAVPEPAAWAMMLVGLFGLGAVMRRDRKQSGAAALA
jgi:hypothetical protein